MPQSSDRIVAPAQQNRMKAARKGGLASYQIQNTPVMRAQRQQIAQLFKARGGRTGSLVLQRERATKINENVDDTGKRAIWESAVKRFNCILEGTNWGSNETRYIGVEFLNMAKSGYATTLGQTTLHYFDSKAEASHPIGIGYKVGDLGKEAQFDVLIKLNAKGIKDETDLYVTFIHEWIAHALPAMDVADSGGALAREADEHKVYSQCWATVSEFIDTHFKDYADLDKLLKAAEADVKFYAK